MTAALLGLAIVGWEPFANGVRQRSDPAAARACFEQAAQLTDDAWAAGHQSLAMARLRVASHRLAGDVPRAILAARQGLALWPWDRTLQRWLERCREAVAYPTQLPTRSLMRPTAPSGLRFRVQPVEHIALSGIVGLVMGIGLATWFTTRPWWSGFVCVIGGVGVLGLTWLSWHLRPGDPAVAVVTTPTLLRTGNAFVYPARIDTPLPRGAEVTPLATRGGWIQVQLAGGVVGWLPERVVLWDPNPSARPREPGIM